MSRLCCFLSRLCYSGYAVQEGVRLDDTGFRALYIPGRGDSVRLDDMSVRLYRKIIEYETDEKVEVRDGMVYIGGSPAESYTFEGNYYFFGGDNVLNSKDSRYIGLVPEEFIVGIATRILFSVDPDTGAFRRDRFMKRIH